MDNKRRIIETIVTILCFIVFLVILIIYKKYIAAGVCIAMALTALVLILIFIHSDKIIKKKEDKYYKQLKEKGNKTFFDKLYILAYNENLGHLLKEKIKQDRIKDVSYIEAYTSENRNVEIFFNYRGFSFYASINDKKANYHIGVSTRYKLLDNKEFEKMRDASFLLKDINSIDDFVDNCSLLIKSVIEEINNYCDLNIVDDTFNGRLSLKLKEYMYYLKNSIELWIAWFVIVTVAAPFLIYRIIEAYDNNAVVIIGSILVGLGIIIFLLSIYYSFYFVLQYRKVKYDINNKETSYIEGCPKRVYISRELSSKFISRLRYIKLYFDGKTLIIPLSCSFLRKHNFKAFYNDCKRIDTKLTYLSKSNVVISGEEKYIKLVNKHFN